MHLAEEKLNLIQKLARIRNISDVAQKSKQGYGYTYSDITEILAKVTAGMKKYCVSLIPIIVPGTSKIEKVVTVNTKTDKQGKTYDKTDTEMLFSADMIYKWINDDNPDEFIDVSWAVVGAQSDPSQAFGSGLTYCERYFLTSYFQIAQSELDVDAYRSKQKAAEASEEAAIAKAIIEQFDTLLKHYLADNQDKKDEVVKFISRYAKKSNYLAIKEPTLASKLFDDFKNTFIKKGE
jgi:hypothetical protein